MKRKKLSFLLAGIGLWLIAATSFAAEAESVRKVIDQMPPWPGRRSNREP